MNYKDFEKKFAFPASFKAPTQLTFEDLRAKQLTREDLIPDMEAVNSSMEVIRKTRGGSWPEEPVSEDFDFLDLAWHEREFNGGESFAYVVYDDKDTYIGCFYLYPLGHRTELTEALLDYDMDASWWVSADAYSRGYYEKLYNALEKWLTSEFPAKKIYYSNEEIPA